VSHHRAGGADVQIQNLPLRAQAAAPIKPPADEEATRGEA
jgi:hypothetical protein